MSDWHSKTIRAMRFKSNDELRFIIKDATEAADIGERIGNPKAGQYRDEVHYAAAELRFRADQQQARRPRGQ